MLLEPNTTASFKVTDQFGTEVGTTNVALRNPAGDVTVITTDENGNYNLTNTLSGMWKFTAVKDGYEPGTKNTLAIDIFAPQVIAAIIVVAGTTTLLPYLIFWLLYKRRSGIFVEPTTIKFVMGEEEIKKCKRLLTLPHGAELYPELQKSGELKAVTITGRIKILSDEINRDYGLTDNVALALAAAKTYKAKKAVIHCDIPEELKRKLKPMVVESILD